jgi:hypothetical protein
MSLLKALALAAWQTIAYQCACNQVEVNTFFTLTVP